MTDLTQPASANPTNSTPPLALRLRSWPSRTVERYIALGKISRDAVAESLAADEAYYTEPVAPETAVRVWRELAAVLGSRNMPPAELAFVQRCFAEDAEGAEWTASQLDRAARLWRNSPERFVPTFGQLAAMAHDARIDSGPRHLNALHDLTRPPRPPRPETPPSPPSPPPTLAEIHGEELASLRESVAKADAERAANRIERDGRPPREWGRIDEMLHTAMKSRLADLEARIDA